MIKGNKSIVISLLSLFLFSACQNYFGNETDISFIEKPEFQPKEVAYVPVQPAWNKFQSPSDIHAGFDELLYVVDRAQSRVYGLDESGRILGNIEIPNVKKVIQDRKFDLLALGTKPATINGVTYDLACIYRIDLHGEGGYGMAHAKITAEVQHPYYLTNTFRSSDADVKFNGLSILSDNSYYVTRSGTDNNPNKVGGPDDAVLLFNSNDGFVSPVFVTTQDGTLYTDYFNQPFGITSLIQPPQISANGPKDFVFTSIANNESIRVGYMLYLESEGGSSYTPKDAVVEDTSEAEGFLTSANKFDQPVSITASGDGTGLIFVVDSRKDSLYQFTQTGLEGIKPPPGSVNNKYAKTSFGGRGSGLMEFNSPAAVAYKNEVVYVADEGNGRILRFKLTLDFD